jgi:hypothetical protein
LWLANVSLATVLSAETIMVPFAKSGLHSIDWCIQERLWK